MNQLSKEQALESLQVYERKLHQLPAEQMKSMVAIMRELIENRFDPNFVGQTIRQLQPEQMSELPSPAKDVA